jgi:hypothetical protein
MRVGSSSVVLGMRSTGAERGAGCPALGGKDAVAEAGGVISPSGVLGVVGDAGATLEKVSFSGYVRYLGSVYFFGAARPIVKSVEFV